MAPCAKGLHHNMQRFNTHLWALQVWSDYENRVTSLQNLDKNAKERTLGCLLVKGMIIAVHSAIEINSRAEQRSTHIHPRSSRDEPVYLSIGITPILFR